MRSTPTRLLFRKKITAVFADGSSKMNLGIATVVRMLKGAPNVPVEVAADAAARELLAEPGRKRDRRLAQLRRIFFLFSACRAIRRPFSDSGLAWRFLFSNFFRSNGPVSSIQWTSQNERLSRHSAPMGAGNQSENAYMVAIGGSSCRIQSSSPCPTASVPKKRKGGSPSK
jgi:hypothetical protein